MHEASESTVMKSEKAFWNASRVKLIVISVIIVWAFAILSRLGLILTKDVDIYPKGLFLYIYMGVPVLVALYIGVKETVYPCRVTLLVSLSWSVIAFLLTWQATETSVVIQTGVIISFIKEGILYAAFLVIVAFVAHKVAMRSNKSLKAGTPQSGAP